MAKVRAYKIAEELGIDRSEFVEKALSYGIELKSVMATLDDAEAELLREKLGERKSGVVTERRVEGSRGAAVIRRRRRAAPPPPPEPVAPVAEVGGEAAQPVGDAEPAVEPVPAPEEEPEPGVELVEPTPEAEPVSPTEETPTTVTRPAAAARPAGAAGPAGPGADTGTAADRKTKQRKRVREVVNLREQEQIARQVTGRTSQRRSVTIDSRAAQSPRRQRRDTAKAPATGKVAPKAAKRVVRVEGEISVAELAKQLGAKSAEVQGKLMAIGTLVSLNQSVNLETATKLATEYGYEVQNVAFREEEVLQAAEPRDAADLVIRPPVVTVMGHVDHGKTSLLDALRKTNVVAGEAGGITQHIGAYQVTVGDRTLSFIDTPGHAAFTEMRARGAQVTDIVILVVAANDGIMPQTVEAIAHAQAAKVPIIVAVNKTDLPEAQPAQVRQRLMEHGLVPEDFGGETICVDVSAVKGTGLDQLLEMVGLQAEVLELKGDPGANARGVVIEAELDKGRGPVATVLVQDGTLRRGCFVVVGTAYGRVRNMLDENGKPVQEAGPSRPVQVVGLSGVPQAGDVLHAVESERDAKQVASHRESDLRKAPVELRPRLTLEEAFERAQEGGKLELPVVLKADTQGSVQAVRDTLEKLSTDQITLRVLHAGVGAISENDVTLARASEAIIVGFHVRPDSAARRVAESQGVDIRVYQIIYEVVDEVRKAMAGMLPPTVKEVVLGSAEVRKTFPIPRVGTVAGCYVTEGLMRRNARLRLVRDGVQVYEGRFASLKRFKDDAREVQTGFECGIGIEGFNDVKLGDVIEAFDTEEQPAEL
jgi:translation initiation factor IF-2